MSSLTSLEVSDGRSFQLRDVGPAEMLDLIEAAGPAASSQAWMRYALMICSVSAIDSKPVIIPLTKDAIRDLGRKIGNVGIEALANYHYPDELTEKREDAEINNAKN